MGKYEEDSNRNIVSLTLSFLKFILVVCNVRCNNWGTYLSGRKLHVLLSLSTNFCSSIANNDP